MARIATSIEESKRLLGLGIDPNTADMRWYREQKWFPYELQPYPYNESIITDGNESMKPAWSLGALLDLCPYDREVYFDRNRYGMYWIDTELTSMPFDGDYIGAMVKTIELLVDEGYIKGKEDKK